MAHIMDSFLFPTQKSLLGQGHEIGKKAHYVVKKSFIFRTIFSESKLKP